MNFQMFKFMLYRAIHAGAFIFKDGDAPPLANSKLQVEEYNQLASQIWKGSQNFFHRQEGCENLILMVVPAFQQISHPVPRNELMRFPASIEKELNAVFHQYYDTPEKYLLFGSTEDEAYDVQDRYALAVVEVLGTIDVRYASRAHLCLRKMYGRGAPLPLLCRSSIDAMWEVCRSSYYRRQVSLVGLGRLKPK